MAVLCSVGPTFFFFFFSRLLLFFFQFFVSPSISSSFSFSYSCFFFHLVPKLSTACYQFLCHERPKCKDRCRYHGRVGVHQFPDMVAHRSPWTLGLSCWKTRLCQHGFRGCILGQWLCAMECQSPRPLFVGLLRNFVTFLLCSTNLVRSSSCLLIHILSASSLAKPMDLYVLSTSLSSPNCLSRRKETEGRTMP
ncbi:hypothetical protein B0T20DRAFT_151315 [Sordaria brevicollis]|uniref:Uncharacterized protein n=1 Tax=Sordaria brevicollis TaxID=83679 RepID=A0AAE0PIN3_SORBR|nr:hypothetical protein B0T20DRAFT_151315 [Sordaria brevicollis]